MKKVRASKRGRGELSSRGNDGIWFITCNYYPWM